VNKNQIFIIRAILGVVFGVILTRFFFPEASVIFIVGLCTALVALAYLTEYLRNRSRARSKKS
jgi:ABC-type Mn2+/Zn2+ transport system permease subunit